MSEHGHLPREELIRRLEQAQAATGARDNLLAAVSHDLRGYLSNVRMSATVIARKAGRGDTQDLERNVETVLRSVTRMERLVACLRDATMIETGQFTVEPEPGDTAALLDDALRSLEPLVESRSLRMSVRLGDDLPPVRCDRDRACQVLANLVGNATRFTAAGGDIRVDAIRVGDFVCIAVSDTGCGIPEEQLAHIFERGWKADKRGTEGSGLGLYIARGIVEAHGGRIWAESRVGVGTTVSFTLPVMKGRRRFP